MMRRSPTRIELRLDDLQEFEVIRKEREMKKIAEKSTPNPPTWSGKTLPSEIQERIGYVPTQSTYIPPPSRSNI